MTSWEESGRLDAQHLTELYADLGQEIRTQATVEGALGAVTRVAVQTVPNASYASITRRTRDATYLTMSATHDAAAIADQMQYDLNSGPCIDALNARSLVVTGDLRIDPRWTAYGPHAVAAAGVRSVLAIALMFDDDTTVAALNIYSVHLNAFADDATAIAGLLASHGALAVTHITAQDGIREARTAVAMQHEVDLAVGVLMSHFNISSEASLDMLRIVSQQTHRDLLAVARDVLTTGTVELPNPSTPRFDHRDHGPGW